MRKSVLWVVFIVICGAIVVSSPLLAGSSTQVAKGKITTVVKGEVVKPAVVQPPVASATSVIVQAIKFQLGHWFGWGIKFDIKHGNGDQPRLGSQDPNARNPVHAIAKDHGGSDVDD